MKAGIAAVRVPLDDPEGLEVLRDTARALAELLGFVPLPTQMSMAMLSDGSAQVTVLLNVPGRGKQHSSEWLRIFHMVPDSPDSDTCMVTELLPPFLVMTPETSAEMSMSEAKTHIGTPVSRSRNLH